jgi:hypothetical protein
MDSKHSSKQYYRLQDFDHIIDVDPPQTTKRRTFSTISLPRRPKGWRTAVTTCAATASVVFLINFVSLIWAVAANGRPQQGRQVLYKGDCTRVRKLNVGVHLLINTLSTILLSSSNYCMQCLCAPTRQEVDVAHSQKRWLDIGIHSVRNLKSINRRRVVLWVLLGASSLPLHLFYNSAVFSSISAYVAPIAAVNEAYLGNATLKPLDATRSTISMGNFTDIAAALANDTLANLTTLSNSDCITAYAQTYVTSRGTVFLIVDDSANASLANTPAFFGNEYYGSFSDDYCVSDPYQWICQTQWGACLTSYDISPEEVEKLRCSNHIADMRANASNWRPMGIQYPVKHCLSIEMPEQCRLQFSIHIGVIVVLLNLVKAVLMLLVAFWLREAPLLTIGDAIASFLRQPDPATKNFGLVSKNDIQAAFETQGIQNSAPPRCYMGERRRLAAAPSKKRWAVMIMVLLTPIFIVASLYVMAVIYLAGNGFLTTIPALSSFGIGAISPVLILSGLGIPQEGTSGLIGNVLLANCPQVVLSIVYFMYNGMFTTMLAAFEYNKYSFERRGLRVSDQPVGAQRSTYFLQLPHKIAVPMMGLSGLLHWLVSQSIFLVAIDQISTVTDYDTTSTLSCGYSPIAMFAVLVLGPVMLLVLIGTGLIRLKKGAPLAGSYSAAISAACHPMKGDYGEDRVEKKIQWGVEGFDDNVGHASFSSDEVYPPIEGAYYR